MREQIVEKHPSIDTFHKGVNESINEQVIGHDEPVMALNVDLSDGTLRRCNGYERIDVNGVPTGNKVLMGMFEDNNSSILFSNDDKIYEVREDRVAVIKDGLSSSDFTFVNYQLEYDDIVVMTNGIDDVLVYDGNKFRPLYQQGIESTDTRAPKGKYIALHQNRLWIAGEEANPNVLYISTQFDIDDWSQPTTEGHANMHGAELHLDTWDGGEIIGIHPLFDDLVVFKNKSVFRVFGTFVDNYSLIQVFDTVSGEILQNTISVLENHAIWASTDGIHIFNGVNSEVISHKVKKTFKRLNREYAHRAVATIYGRKYILSIPIDDSKVNNLIIEYDMDTNAFVFKDNIDATSFLEIDGKLLFTNQVGAIFEYDKGDTFDGKPIHMIWESGMNTYGEQQARKILNRIYFTASGKNGVRIKSTSERKEVEKVLALTDEKAFYRERLRNKGRLLKFTIENIDGGELELAQFQYMLDLDYD